MPPSRIFVLTICSLVFVSIATAQPTNNVWSRMTIVKSNFGSGTAFSIDVDHREYWITAKHILTGAKHPPHGRITTSAAAVKVLDPGAEHERWISINFAVLDPGSDVDIIVLAAPTPLLPKTAAKCKKHGCRSSVRRRL
jgi:hypothetical protein